MGQALNLRFLGWFVLLFAVTQIPLFGLTYPDLADYPNHAARLHVLLHIDSSAVFQQFYRREFSLAPNMAMDLLALPLAHVFGAALGLKVFASMGNLLLLSGAVALNVALAGRVSALALGALLFAASSVYHWGLFSFIFGTGLGFWALATWVWMRRTRRPSVAMLAAFTGAALAVYLCHLAAFGVYMLGLAAFELGRESDDSPLKRVASAALATGVQALPALVIHVLAYAPAPASEPAFPVGPQTLADVAIYKILQFLYTPALLIDTPMAVTTMIVVFAAMWIGWGINKRALTLSRPGLFITGALFLAVLLLPPTGFGSALVDRRILLPLALAAWASLLPVQGRLSAQAEQWVTWGIAAGVLLITSATFHSWSKLQSPERDLRAAMSAIEVGSKVAVVRIDGKQVDLSLRPHTASWSVVDRSVFLSSLYMKPFTPLALRCMPEFVPLARLAQLGADNRAPSFAAIKHEFDYAVVFGQESASASYTEALPALFLSRNVRLVRLRDQPRAAAFTTKSTDDGSNAR